MTEEKKKEYLKKLKIRLSDIQDEMDEITDDEQETDKVITTVYYDLQDIITYLNIKLK